MDLDKIIEADNQKMARVEAVRKMQRNVIKEFEKVIELGQALTNKLAINHSYREEVQKFFLDKGFVKSDTNHEGRINMSNLTTYYKNQNTWITISFSEYSENENIIDIVLPLNNQGKRLIYKLNDEAMNTLILRQGFILNNEHVYLGSYEEVISGCDSIEELTNLDNQLKEHIQYLQENLNKDINTDGVYQLPNKKQFKTFKEAFEAL